MLHAHTGTSSSTTKVAKPRWVLTVGSLRGWTVVRRYGVLIIVLCVMIGPIFIPLLGAFKDTSDPIFGPTATIFPRHWSLQAFIDVFTHTSMLRYIFNSLLVCSLAVISALIMSALGGYMLSRKGWKGRSLVFLFVISGMIFPFESIMLSLYSQVRGLGLFNTIPGIWVPKICDPFHLLLMRSAFLAIPDDIEDAAYIDGASEWKRFLHIMLPQTKGALVIVGLTAFIFAWQDFLWPLLVVQSDDVSTVTLGITRLNSAFGTDYRLVLAGALISILPILIVFFISQRYFFRGIEEGGLKF